MVILVLTMHATDTYSPFGNWYYTDRADSSLGTIVFFAIYQSFLQAFFMGLLFFVSGYFTAQAWERKNVASFIRGRFVRLGIPTLLYMFVIGPLTQYFLSHTCVRRDLCAVRTDISLPMAADFRSAVCAYLIDARSAFATSLAISSCTANLSSNGRS
jgi:hypothetical protein